jgi:hypothetical protein
MRFTKRVKGFVTVAAVTLAACLTFGVASAGAWNMIVNAHTKVDRPFTWTIEKTASDPVVNLAAGQTTTETYTVKVTATAGAASNWKVYGDVTVGVDPDRQIGEITGGIVPQNIFMSTFYLNMERITCPQPLPYLLVSSLTCTWGDIGLPDASGGTVILRGFESTTGPQQVVAQAPFDFTNPDVVTSSDDCVDVSDTFKGILGANVCATSSPQPFTFTYTRTLGPYNTCGTFYVPNTASFKTNASGTTGSASANVKVVVTGCASGGLTPGYWKNHLSPATSKNGPWTSQYLALKLGNYTVDTTAKVTAEFDGMNCSSSSSQNAVGCLAGHLLASKLNVANGASNCIAATIANADAFLKGQTVNGVAGINYAGPSGSYSLSAAQRSLAISLKTVLDTYNNGTCPI